MPNKVDYRTFSQRVKNKYPEYINMGDLELAQMWVEQNPQYGEFVMFDQQPVKKKDQAAPSLGAQGGLPSQQPSVQPRKAKEERFFGGAFGNLLDALDMPTPGVPGSGLGIGDFIDDMGRAFSSGKKAGVNISTSRPLFFSGPGSSDEEVQNFVKAGTEYTGPSDEATQFYKDYEDSGKTTFGFVKALAKNPGVAPELVVQSASQFLFNPEARAAFGTAIAAGAGIGAVASAPLGGIGAAPGAIAAILPGVAAANTAVSTLSSFSELMKQELDQRGLEFNEDNVRTILEDEKALRKIRAKSAGYGITIGAFDLATAKVGGAIAAKIPMTTRAGKIKSTLATTGVEAVGGSAGEAAARGVTGQELDPAEIGLEGIAEIPGAAPTLLSQVLKRPTYKINGEFVGQADVDDILQNSTRQELENTKFEVFNDVNMYGSKFRNRLEELGLLEEIIEANPNAQEADINRLFELNSKLKKVENLNSESAKASANWLRSQIKEVQDGLLTQEFAPQVAQQAEEAAPEAPQMAPAEVSPEVGMEIPQEDQGVLQVINSVIQPISSGLEARMNNAEEIPMSEIESVVDALIDAQQSVRSQEGARTRQTQGGFVTEFGALSDQQKRNFDTLIEQQINKLLNYEFATITTTEQAGEKTKTAGLVATPREGRPLPESVVSRDRFDGAGVRIGGRGAGRITVKKIPGFGGRSVYGVSFGNRKGVAPVEDLEFDNLEFVAPEILADGSFNARVKDSKSGLEFTITDPELSIDLAIAAQLKEAGRKEFPQPAFLEAVREVTQGQPAQVTTFPNLGRTGTTPAAVGVEPQTEQDVRQETNAPQEGRGQGEDAAPVPQEEGRQEGQVTPPAVAQEGETPPAAKRTRKTKQQIADESNAALEELKKTIGVLQASKKKPLFQRPGQKAEIDEDTQIELASEEAGISPKNFRDLYRVNRELFGLNQSEAMSAAIAMDKMIDVMAKRAGVSKTEMYGRLNFKKSTEQDLPQSAIKQDKEEILRVFHGTSKDKDFKKFKDTGKGVFVTISPKEASEYAEQNDSMKFGDYDPITRKFREINTASRVIPMNLNLGNSYKLTKADIEFLNSRPNYSALQKELHARIKANGFDTIDYGNGVYAVLTEGRLRSMLTNEVLFQKDLPQGVKFQVDAWHGSPYQFDKFTTDRIGTGEGAQAFGWGLYFTDLESIARNYAKRLSGDVYSYDGKLISKEANDYLFLADDSLGDNFNENTIRDIAKVAINKIRKEYIPDLKEVAKTSPSEKQRSNIPNEVKRLEGVIKELENIISSKEIKLEKNKILYKASINKGKTPDQYTWVEWDKPVGEENAKRILAQLKKEGLLEKAETNWSRKNMSGSFSGKESLENDLKNLRGDHLYERFLSPRVTPVADGLGTAAINRLFGSAKEASLFLLRSGIDGNKYPAESIARGATSDTARGFNYVVFDENAVSIEEVIKFQEDAVKARGAMMITLDGQATIYALTDPNVSTPLHELTHVFEHYLTDEEKATVQEWAKTKDWTIKTSEAFARGFEKYLAEGKAPTPALQKIFDNFKQWLTDIYRGIVGSDIDIELNEPMRDLYAKMFEFTGEDGPSNFEKWKGDNKLLVGPDIQDAKTGEPIVVRAYHGTTNEFYEFDSSVKGSVEGHLGKINYFTSDYQDAAINYLSEGTDLTNRVEGRTDQIMSELENNYDDYYESIPELSRKYGYTEEELQDDFVSFRSLARDLAKKELYGGTNKVLDVFIKLNNPVVLGKGSTWFQTLNISEADFDQAAQEIADENDISVEEAKQDYDFDIRDRAIENAGYENLAVEALDSALRSNGYRGASASEILGDNLYESDIDLNRLEKELRQNDKAGLFENEEGEFASSQVVSDFLKNLGFDGIILTDVSSRFRGMGLGSLTSHIHVFDEFANQIKLADGSNTTFGETRDIRFQLDEGKSQQQAQPEAKVEATAKALEGLASDKFRLESGEGTPTAINVDYGDISWPQSGLSSFNEGSDGKTYMTDKNGDIYQVSKTKLSANKAFLVTIKNTNGEEVGYFEFKRNSDGSFSAEEAYTSKKGVGIATIAYDLASKDGEIIRPSKKLKKDGVRFWAKSISNAYHKAKTDGSNPKLVKAVDELLGQTPEAKQEKTIAEKRKEFRETAKKYFEGMKKMGVIFDAERNASEDIAFIKALTKYIKLEIDNGMVTFKGFIEKTAGMIEDFNDNSVKRLARDIWSKEIVKAYPKLYAKLQKAQKALLDKELVDARKELRINLKNLLSDKKIFKQISSLTTERKLDKSSSDILVGIRSEIEAFGGIGKLSDEQLISYNELATETYKEGRINQKQFIDALAKEKAETSKNAKSAITNQGERSAVKLKDAEEAREFLAENNGDNSNQVNINNGEVIVESVEDFDAILPLIGKGATFGGTTTSPNPNNVKRGKKNFFRTTLGGGLIYLLDKFKGKNASKETIDFFNSLQEEVKAGTRQKKRLKATLNNQRKVAIERIFRGQARYIAFMLSRPKVNGKRLVIKDNNGKEIKRINVAGVLYYYQLMKDPHFLKKDGNGERKIGLSESSMKDIVDFINLPENAKVRELINIDQLLIKKAAQNAAQVMEANNISSELFTPRPLDLSKYENDKFIGEILNKIYNNAVPSEIEYFPSNVESDANSQVPEVDALLDQEMDTNAVSAMSRFMIERVSGGKVRIRSYDAQLGEYFDSMSNTASKLPILKKFQAVFNKENSNLISSYYGKNTTDELRENIGRYITSRQQDSGLAKYISSGPLGKWLASGLGVQMVFAFTSAFSQLSSTPGPILSYGVKNYLDGLLMLTSGKVNAREAIVNLTEGSLFRERFGSRIEVADIVKSIPSDETGFASYVNEINKKLISIGAIPSSAFDALSIILSLPIYAREYSNALKTMTRKEAADYAENVLMDKAENFLQSKSDEMMSSFESKHRTTLYAFATVVPQLQRQAIMAFKRIQRGEGDLAQNINVLVWSGIGSSVAFRLLRPYFESLFEGDDDDEELKKLRDDKRLKRTTIDLAVDATKSLGTWGAISAGVLKTAYQLAEAEGDASVARRALDITPEVLEFVPAVSIKVSSINNAIKSYYDDEDLRGTTQSIQALTNIPAEKARGLAVQMSDAFLIDQFTLGERLTRLAGFVSENKAKEKMYQKSISTNPEMRELLSPSEIQRFESKQKSEYKSATSAIAKQYSEATTQQDRDAAMSKLFSLQASTTKYSAKESGELIQQIQDDFDNKVVENSLPEGFLEIKRMPSTKKVNFVANEFNKIENYEEALSYVESLYMYGVISENERGEVFDILLQTKPKQ